MNLASTALDDLRVVDASTILAGPLCCRILGDYGADVIKIEHPRHGDGMRGHGRRKNGIPIWWKEISRNKRAAAADLGTAEGAEILRRLVATADVLVENFRPGTLERWGLDPVELQRINPRLVIVRLTGFGQTGPYAPRAGFGTLAEAMSGFAMMTGEADGPPTLPPFGLADTICGIAAATATLTALHERDRTGLGQIVDISILEPMLSVLGPGPAVYQQLGVVDSRNGNRSINNAPRNIYRTSDDKWVAVSTSAQSVADRVLVLVGRPDIVDEDWFSSGHGRVQHVELLDRIVGDWIAARPQEEVIRAFDEAGAAIAPVYDARDVVEDPHIRQTGMLVEVEDADLGPVLQHNVLWRLSRTPGRIRHTGRELGADTDAVLAELGYRAAEVAALRDKGVVR